MLEQRYYCAFDTVFPIIEVYISRATELQNDAIMTGVLRMYFNMMSEVVSQNYCRGWSAVELETLRKNVCVFKHKAETIFCLYAHPNYFPQSFIFWTI